MIIPARVPIRGAEARAFNAGLPALQERIKSRYENVESVEVWCKNPRPDVSALTHDAWIVILLFSPFAKRIQERLADDVYAWLKEVNVKVRRKRRKRRRRTATGNSRKKL